MEWLALLIYVDNILGVALKFSIALISIAVVMFFVLLFCDAMDPDTKAKERGDRARALIPKHILRWYTYLAIALVVFIPHQEQRYLIYGVLIADEVAESEVVKDAGGEVKNVGGDIYRVVKKALEVAENKLDENLTEEK